MPSCELFVLLFFSWGCLELEPGENMLYAVHNLGRIMFYRTRNYVA